MLKFICRDAVHHVSTLLLHRVSTSTMHRGRPLDSKFFVSLPLENLCRWCRFFIIFIKHHHTKYEKNHPPSPFGYRNGNDCCGRSCGFYYSPKCGP